MADAWSTFNSNPNMVNQNTGAVNWDNFYKGITPTASKSPTFQSGMLGRGLPTSYGMDRLPQGTAGLPNPSPGSGLTQSQLAALGGYTVDPRTGKLNYITPTAQPTQVAGVTPPVPLNRPSAFANYMEDPAYAAAYLEQYGVPPPTTAVAADLATTPPAGGQLAALLEAAQGLGGLLSGVLPGGAPVPATRPRIAANALIDGQRGKDNMPGANYMGRSVGTDGVVRGYNQSTKRWENLSQNSKKSPSQSYKKDRLGDRDMRQTSKQKYNY